MKATIEGKELVIRISLIDPPRASATGKTLVVASTNGNRPTEATINGQPVIVGVNAYLHRSR